MPKVLKINKGIFRGGGFQIDIASVTPVTPIRTAAGNKFFPAKADGTTASVPCLDVKAGFVYKHTSGSRCYSFRDHGNHDDDGRFRNTGSACGVLPIVPPAARR